MGHVIGMDEAGYGPNLGPLVISTSVWETPGDPFETDFWQLFAPLISQTPTKDRVKIQVADSKSVYSSTRGIAPLEKGVLSALRLLGHSPTTFHELWELVTVPGTSSPTQEPWFADSDCKLPLAADESEINAVVADWRELCEATGIQPVCLRSDLVLTERFNRLTDQFDSKGVTLSTLSLQLLGNVWSPESQIPTHIIGDKHGGRNRYDELLESICGEEMIFRQQEGRHLSSYRVGQATIQFRTKAESHFPVALASMLCKYLREVAMELFNAFWLAHLPELKPTKGYPVDAGRYRKEIANVQKELGISDDCLWRKR